MAITIAARSAELNLLMLNPGTIFATNISSKAFITKIKSPSVTMVMGRVKRTRRGFIKKLTTAKIRPETT